MRDGRKLLEQLRDVFQNRVDDIERIGSSHLDVMAERGVREIEELREEIGRRTRKSRKRHSRRGHRRCGRGSRGRSTSRSGRGSDPEDRDPEQIRRRRAVRRARRRANARMGFFTHFFSFAATLAVILVATRSIRVAMIVAFFWGIGVFCHYLFAVAAPALRDRWVESEVDVRSPRAVASERRHVEERSRRSMEDLSASIAHEIRNPITAAKSLVQQMGEDPSSSENLEYAEVALSELDRVERSISHLLRYARDEEPRLEPVALRDVARAAVDGLRERARSAGVELHGEFDSEGMIRGDVEKLRRVVENLITNAIDALAEAHIPNARIEVVSGENLAGTEVWLRVADNGPGIPEEDRERIFSPFYTTKESGTGLGLALSRKTIEAHGGRVDVNARPPGGTEFEIAFPKDPEWIGDPEGGAREGASDDR